MIQTAMRATAVLALGAALAAPTASAQTVTLDEGTFRLMMDGREVGVETFSIKRSGSGANAITIAQGRVVLNAGGAGEELDTSLEVLGPALRPSAYQITVSGDEAERIFGRVVGGRFSARIVSSSGEMMREYLAGEGAVVVDEGVAHHYFFLSGSQEAGDFRVPLIIPRQNRQVSATVSQRGSESIRIGGESVQARRLQVDAAGAGTRHVWVDAQGRVLRLELPERGFVAERTALPG